MKTKYRKFTWVGVKGHKGDFVKLVKGKASLAQRTKTFSERTIEKVFG